MGKFLIRWTVILSAVYLIVCYLAARFFLVDIWSQAYYLLFILCVCLCISKQGVYHCRFVKWTAYAILIEETITYLDVVFDFIPDNATAVLAPTIIAIGLVTTTTLAIRHYIKVRRLKKIWQINHPQ